MKIIWLNVAFSFLATVFWFAVTRSFCMFSLGLSLARIVRVGLETRRHFDSELKVGKLMILVIACLVGRRRV